MPSGRSATALVDRVFHIAAERQNIAAVAHGDGEADGGLAVDAKHRLRRIGKGAAHFGDVAQPDQPSVREKVDVENVVFGAEGARHADRKLLVAGLQRARGADRILRLQRGDQSRPVDAESGELLRRKLDENLLVLRAEDFDLRHVRNLQQARADVLDIVAQLAMGESVGGEAVDQSVGVAEVVVEAGTDDAGRQRVADVADVLANLIPDVGNLGGGRRSFQVDEDGRDAGTRVAAQKVEALGFLQFALEPFGDLLQACRRVSRRARRPARSSSGR